MKKTQ